MRTLAVIFAVFVVSILGWQVIREEFFVADWFRYRLTVNFEADGQKVSGSNVTQVTFHTPPCYVIENVCGYTKIRGDAFPIRFPNGAILIVMEGNVDQTRHGLGTFTFASFPYPGRNRKTSDLPHRPYPVKDVYMPSLLYFGDLKNPQSVRLIDPHNMPTVFGNNVRYLGSTVELTNDPITWNGIKKMFPWISSFEAKQREQQKKLLPPHLWPDFTLYFERNDL